MILLRDLEPGQWFYWKDENAGAAEPACTVLVRPHPSKGGASGIGYRYQDSLDVWALNSEREVYPIDHPDMTYAEAQAAAVIPAPEPGLRFRWHDADYTIVSVAGNVIPKAHQRGVYALREGASQPSVSWITSDWRGFAASSTVEILPRRRPKPRRPS